MELIMGYFIVGLFVAMNINIEAGNIETKIYFNDYLKLTWFQSKILIFVFWLPLLIHVTVKKR